MTTAPAQSRYVIEQTLEQSRRGLRGIGEDQRLHRKVLLWVMQAPEDDPGRQAFFALARQCARLKYHAFLPVLDAATAPDSATIAIQAPPCESLTAGSFAAFQEQGGARVVLLEVARALVGAARLGLHPRWLPLSCIYACHEGVRIDPLGILARPDEAPGDPVPLLLGMGQAMESSDDPQLADLLTRWRNGVPAEQRTLERLAEELELLAPDASTYLMPLTSADTESTMALPALPGYEHAGQEATEYVGQAPWDVTDHVGQAPSPVFGRQPHKRSSTGTLVAVAAVVTGGILLGMAIGSFGAIKDAWNQLQQHPTAQAADQGQPTPVPANMATLRLTPQQDTQVRVTVDGGVAFNGVLKAGQSQTWQGSRNVGVATNGGQTLNIEVNGHNLGPLSPAVGHPEWNAVDWAWPAGWKPPGSP